MDVKSPQPAAGVETDSVFFDVYARLKAMASRQRLRNGSPATLCTTELVHEAYLRMTEADYRYKHDMQFFAYAARAMRHVITDAARRRLQPKRGGNLARLALDHPAAEAVRIDPRVALQLDDALQALEKEDARAAQVVELHYFAGLDMEHIAKTLGVVRRTVDRDWRYARAFLAARTDA